MDRFNVQLLSAAGIHAGVWHRVPRGVEKFSVVLSGTFAATADVRVSNGLTKPDDADTTIYPRLGTGPVTAPVVLTAENARWVKAHISAHDSGTVKAVTYAPGYA